MQISEPDSEGLMCTVCYLRGWKLNPSNFHHCPCRHCRLNVCKAFILSFLLYHVYKLNTVVKYQLVQVIFCVKYQAPKNRTMTFRYQGLQWIYLHDGLNVLFTICWFSVVQWNHLVFISTTPLCVFYSPVFNLSYFCLEIHYFLDSLFKLFPKGCKPGISLCTRVIKTSVAASLFIF